jgi:hypothetical protein
VTTPEFKYLARVMQCEMNDTLFQPRPSAMLDALVEDGLLQRIERIDDNLRVRYVAFTQVGHMTYCQECSKRYPDEE